MCVQGNKKGQTTYRTAVVTNYLPHYRTQSIIIAFNAKNRFGTSSTISYHSLLLLQGHRLK